MGCGGDGTVEREEPIKMPDAQKLADLLLSQQWVAFDSSAEYEEFVSALGCNLYDPSVQPAPGGEDVVLSAASTASAEQAEPVAEMKGSYLYPLKSIPSGTKLYAAPDALQVENERLREQVERLKANFDSDIKFIGENYSEIEVERDALKAIIEGLFRCDEGDNGEHQYHVGWNDCVEYIQAQAAVARTAKPEVKS